jgi:hypothetical protein
MIPKKPAPDLIWVGTRFRKRSCSSNELDGDDDSKNSHRDPGGAGATHWHRPKCVVVREPELARWRNRYPSSAFQTNDISQMPHPDRTRCMTASRPDRKTAWPSGN